MHDDDNPSATVIASPHYRAVEDKLMQDPLVQTMAAQVLAGGVEKAQQLHLWDTAWHPSFAFMQMCNARFSELGGRGASHIGAVANSVIRLIRAALAHERREKIDSTLSAIFDSGTWQQNVKGGRGGTPS
jgi:hypothetical protein